MATDYYWTGGTSNVWTLPANWSVGTNYPGQAAGDKAFFIYEADNYPAVSLDGDDDWVVSNLAAIHVGAEYPGTIGLSTEKLRCGADNVYIDAAISGDIWLEGLADDVDNDSIDYIYLINGAPGSTIHLAGHCKRIYGGRGNVEIDSGATIATALELFGISSPSDLTLTIQDTTGSATSLPGTVKCGGAIVENYAVLGTLYFAGGIWTQGKDGGNSNISGALGTLCQLGGTYKWNKGNMTKVDIYSGLFDGSNGRTTRTLSTLNGYGGVVDLRTGTYAITVSAINKRGAGSIIYSDIGAAYNLP